MVLKELTLKRAYDSDVDDILNDFYIPILSNSKKYCRLAGFFSSSILALAARGITKLISNGGEMCLICSIRLIKQDIDAINNAIRDPEKIIEENALKEIMNIEDGWIKDHVGVLAWMIAKKILTIKIAIVEDQDGRISEFNDGLFHQKVGICEDYEGNIISFSGSDNETAASLMNHIEEFKVFRSWNDEQREYLNEDVEKFRKFWNNNGIRTRVFELSDAIKSKLITYAPDNIEDINISKWYSKKEKAIRLFKYQEDAIDKWVKNNRIGIFEMATGTGKTFTALGCYNNLLHNNDSLVTIISCPYQHLITQWKNEILKFGISTRIMVSDSTQPLWKDLLADTLIEYKLGKRENLIVLTTHRTLSSKDFISIMKENVLYNYVPILLIVDEVHGIGAEISRNGLLDEYQYRLGLSATPNRWFDSEGTDVIFNYFKGSNSTYEPVFVFSLRDAINTINPITRKTYLTPYVYNPIFTTLTQTEIEKYIKLTKTIISNYSKIDIPNERELIEYLLFKRKNIIKNAENKYQILEDLLLKLGENVKWTIIYCSPQQIKQICSIVYSINIRYSKFTMETGTRNDEKYNGKTEREYILEKFASGDIQVLIAMKCLDEGVDIPPARTSILLSSSGNPREFIQRIGRVIRRYEDKEESIIYDIIIKPNLRDYSSEYREIEKKIFNKEIDRYFEIAKNSKYPAHVLDQLKQIQEEIG